MHTVLAKRPFADLLSLLPCPQGGPLRAQPRVVHHPHHRHTHSELGRACWMPPHLIWPEGCNADYSTVQVITRRLQCTPARTPILPQLRSCPI